MYRSPLPASPSGEEKEEPLSFWRAALLNLYLFRNAERMKSIMFIERQKRVLNQIHFQLYINRSFLKN